MKLTGNMLSVAIALTLGTVALPIAAATPAAATLPPNSGKAYVDGHVQRITRDAQGRALYMVMLTDPPAARYHGAVPSVDGLAKIPSVAGADGRVDLKSTQATLYANHLVTTQAALISKAQSMGIPVQPIENFSYALNGFSAWLSEADAKRIAAMPNVRKVTMSHDEPLDTDRGPTLIGAPKLWFGSTAATGDTLFLNGFEEQPAGNRGEGQVIGMLDTGINFDNHAFDNPDPSGYTYINPFGSGNYLGWCNAGYAAQDPCSDKIIGSWDFVTAITQSPNVDPPGAEDENGHGSHTSSTAGGNTHEIEYLGNRLTISGVAPHANLIAYDVCYTTTSGSGSCPNVATSAAVEQVLKDGVVGVINYSIGGGSAPWDEPTESAFLSAVDSGVFVAASAGNSGPSYGTTGHLGPWVTTVAASTHDRAGFAWVLSPQGGADITMSLGPVGTPPTSALPAGTTMVLSPNFQIATTSGADGCSAYPANTFQSAIALVSRGTCSFAIKAGNAVAAGAVAVVIANNQGGTQVIQPGGTPQATVPVFGISQNDGTTLQGLTAGGPIAASFSYPATIVPETPDEIADFSSRGPGSIDVLKPDVSAPGVSVLAAYMGDADAVTLMDGTSMASPHVAGSAALLRNAHPEWSPMEIKSALMLTAKTSADLLDDDGVSPANPLEAGAGRIQVDQAAKSGLVMRESGINMQNANPATGGDPSTLNLASAFTTSCILGCEFDRRMTGALPGTQQWTVAAQIESPLTVSVPPNFSVGKGASAPITVAVDSSQAVDYGIYFGEVTLTASGNTDTPVLHMPIAVTVPPPSIGVAPAAVDQTVATGAAAVTVDLVLANVGGVPSSWSWLDQAGAPYTLVNQIGNDNNGYQSSTYTAAANNVWEADDFVAFTGTQLTTIQADGFQLPNIRQLAAKAANITFRVYADASGAPAGIPDGTGAAPVFECIVPITSPALGSVGSYDGVALDIATSGCTAPTLTAGTYWLSVSADYPVSGSANTDNAWYRFMSTTGAGAKPMVSWDGSGQWYGTAAAYGDPDFPGFAMKIGGTAVCDQVAWLTPSATTGSIGIASNTTVTLTLDPTSLSAGDYTTNACIGSDDPVNPVVVVPVTLHVTP